jgi:hypothetical protein
MAYVPGYAADLFISYAHRNNHDGWVTELKSRLAGSLADLSADVDIWFDADRLRTGDTFKQEIRDKLSDTMMMVSIVSPAYVQSEFCMAEELDWFRDNFGREIIQLLPVPLAQDQSVPLPESLFEVMYDSEGVALRGEALQPAINKLAWTIRGKLEAARADCKKVYLASSKQENVRARREDVKKLLHHQKRIVVLPNEVVTPRTSPNRLLKWLGEAELSVHLAAPDDALARLQLEVAQSAGKPVLTFSPQEPASDVAAAVQEVLAKLRRERQIYLVYDPATDSDPVRAMSDHLTQACSCKVIEPQAGESYHRARLSESEGILFYHHHAPEQWRDRHRETLRQVAASLRAPRPEAWYFLRSGLPGAFSVASDSNRPHWTIERTGSLDLSDLKPFVDAFNSGRP